MILTWKKISDQKKQVSVVSERADDCLKDVKKNDFQYFWLQLIIKLFILTRLQKFDEISKLFLYLVSKVWKLCQNFVAFSEYMNFNPIWFNCWLIYFFLLQGTCSHRQKGGDDLRASAKLRSSPGRMSTFGNFTGSPDQTKLFGPKFGQTFQQTWTKMMYDSSIYYLPNHFCTTFIPPFIT